MKAKQNKPHITKKKNGEFVMLKNWEIRIDLVEKLKEKAKKEGLSETFLVHKALINMLLEEPIKNL